MPKFQIEFSLTSTVAALAITAAYVGMILGASGWGVMSDIIGRRPAFSITLAIAAVCGTISAFSPNFPFLCVAFALMAVGVGGNLPVDGSLFLEFIPKEKQNLLTLLSIFWPIGQVINAILSWALIPRFSCNGDEIAADGSVKHIPCNSENNRGWRYVLFALGMLTILMVVSRLLLFRMYESPKFLLSVGRVDDAMDVLNQLAEKNGVELDINPEELRLTNPIMHHDRLDNKTYSLARIKPLFHKDMLRTTILVWMIWSLVSVGYAMFNGFLPTFLKNSGGSGVQLDDNTTYRNALISSLCGAPGSIAAMFLVETRLGRIWTMSLATLGTALSLYLLSLNPNPTYQIVVTCFESFMQNAMYGVLYAYSPEVFRTEYRGTAVGIASALARIFGTVAPIITGALIEIKLEYALYVSSGLFLAAFLCMVFLPVETRGRQAI